MGEPTALAVGEVPCFRHPSDAPTANAVGPTLESGAEVVAWFNRFFSWLRSLRRKRPVQNLCLTYYTRKNCRLCKEAYEIVRSAQAERGFALKIVDIDCDPQLERRYGDKVPVLAVADPTTTDPGAQRDILWGVIQPALLKRFLDGAAKSRS